MPQSTEGAQKPVSEDKLWTPAFILMLALGLFTSAASQMVTPNLPEYIINRGASLTLASTIASLMSFIAMVFRPFSGAASDLMSRKKLMLFSTALTAFCLVGYAYAPNIGILVFFRILHGIAFAVQGVTHMAFTTSFIPKSRIGEGLGYLALGNILSQTVGPSIGIWLSDSFGSMYMFITAAIVSLASVLIIVRVPYTFVRPPVQEGHRFPKIRLSNLIAKEVLFYAFLIGMFSCGNALVSTFIKLLAKERGIANIGLYFTANSLMMVVIRPLAGKLTDKKGLAFILYPAYIIEAAAMACIGFAGSLWLLLAAGVLKAIGQGSGAPAIQAASIKKVGVERSGVAISTCYIGQDLMHVVGPILGASLVERTNYKTLFIAFAAVLIIVDISYIIYRKCGGENYLKNQNS